MFTLTPVKVVLTYITITILTFGASYNLEYKPEKTNTPDQRISYTMESAFCSVFWPIYLSVKAFSPLRPKQPLLPEQQ